MRDLSPALTIVQILADGQFHSGEALGEQLGMSRAGINKYIKQIRQWGLVLNSVQGKGYQLAAPLQLLDAKAIAGYYPANQSLQLQVIPVIDSTNAYLLSRLHELHSGDACVAEYQQHGRGRRGRQWFSPFGSNLYLSLYWQLEQGPAAAMGLSLLVGIEVAKVLRQLSGQDIRLKWPNDLYLQDKKLAGILVEIAGKTGDCAHIVIGIGINLLMQQVDETMVTQQWTNLGEVDRNQLVATLLFRLRQKLTQFEQVGLGDLVTEWNKLDNFGNRPVKLLIGDRVVHGIARGINEQGALLLEQQGKIEPYIGGEISLRADD